MPETGQEPPSAPPPPPPPKESFYIKNLLNGDPPKAAPKQPRALFAPSGKADGSGFALSQVGDLSFPRFEIPAPRFALSAHCLERAQTWWYPYALTPAGAHLPRTEGTAPSDPPTLRPSFLPICPSVLPSVPSISSSPTGRGWHRGRAAAARRGAARG